MIVRGPVAVLRATSVMPVAKVPAAPLAVAQHPGIRFTGPVTAADAVAPRDLASLVGQSVFLRIARRDGRSEIVAGEIAGVTDNAIVLARFDVAAAQRLAAAGDDFWIRPPSQTSASIPLQPGDVIRTAVTLPIHVGTAPKACSRRIDLRGHAQAVLDGHAAPRVATDDVAGHLARDATGEPYVSPSGRRFLDASAAADLKAEQNAIVMALSKPVTSDFIAAARRVGIPEHVQGASRPLDALAGHLAQLALDVTTRFTRTLARQPDEPLGRAWQRLVAVHGVAQQHLLGAIVSDSPTHMIAQGMVTPVEILTRLTEVADALGEGRTASDVLRASLPLVMKLAATHQQVLANIVDALDGGGPGGRWSPQHFRLADGRLELTSDFVQELATTRGVRFDALPAKTTGCPAAQTFAGANSIREFVTFYADLVEQLAR